VALDLGVDVRDLARELAFAGRFRWGDRVVVLLADLRRRASSLGGLP
jgi:hypothetical protein